MKMLALLGVIASIGCSTVQARNGSKSWTCIPNDAHDRGPFMPEPAKGSRLTVTTGAPAEVKVAEH